MKHTKLLTAAVGIAVAGMISVSASADTPKYTVVMGTVPASLTGVAGNAENGRKLAISRKKGNCLACHVMPIPEQQFHGLVAPALNGIARHTSESEFRMRLVDPKVINEDTMMPSFYKVQTNAVLKKFKGKTILKAQEIEDIIAYLMTLK